jgi:hypothetical protein
MMSLPSPADSYRQTLISARSKTISVIATAMFALGVYRDINNMAVFKLLSANMAVLLPGLTGGQEMHILRVLHEYSFPYVTRY